MSWFEKAINWFASGAAPVIGEVQQPVIYPAELGEVIPTDEDIINLTEEKICTTEMEEKLKTATKS